MDNHDRWRLADFATGTLDVIRPHQLLAWCQRDPTIARWVGAWFSNMARRPLCMTCETVFDDLQPRLWAVVTLPDQMLLSGLCAACSRADDLMPRAIAALRAEGLVVGPIEAASLGSGGSA